MIRFFVHCYLLKVKFWRGLFVAALVPAAIYCIAAASQPDRYAVSQKVAIPLDAPVSVADSPSEFAPLQRLLMYQDELFLDPYTIQSLRRELQKEMPPQSLLPAEAQLLHDIKKTMSLAYQRNWLQVAYSGPDRAMGEFLTMFYARKVLKKAEDGVRRQEMLMARQAQEEGRFTPVAGAGPVLELKGALVVESQSALWRAERLPMVLALLGAGLAGVLLLIGILEMLDTSFKSERQVARFLHVPVLGMVPNLSRVSKVMSIKI